MSWGILVIRLFRKDSSKRPNHVGLTMDGTFMYASKNKVDIAEALRLDYQNLTQILAIAVKRDIPILTFNLFPESMKKSEHFSEFMDFLVDSFRNLVKWSFIHQNQVKVSVFGKWYDLPGRVVDPIKDLMNETKDYDKFFLNFCINYNGQHEIVDACRLFVMQAMAGKINPDNITAESIKENLYTSYFLPPDLIIKTGKVKKLKGFLLWDSVDSTIYFPGKYWPEFTKADFEKALDAYGE